MGKRPSRGSLFRSAVIAIAALGLAAGVAASNSTKLTADLRGTNEVPVADLDGRGKAAVRIDVEGGEVCFDVSFKDGGTANRGHIHEGAAGANGPIRVAFFDIQVVPDQSGDPRHDLLERNSGLSDCVSADPVLLQRIVDNPSGFYVNLHNARFPGGFVRGQLEAGGG